MAPNFLQQLLRPEGLFLRPGEELLIPVRYRVTGDDTSLELSGIQGMVLYDPTQLSFLGYDEQTALTVDLFQEPDQSYSEAELYESLNGIGKNVNPDLDGVEATTAAIPFIYMTGSDALFDDDPNTTWDGNPNWPGINATAATSETGLTLFNLKFEALPEFSGSPLTVIVLDTHEGYSGLGDETLAELKDNDPDPENTGSVDTKIQLRANNNNYPGDVIASKAIGVGDTFFIEILAADNRPNPAGIIGLQLDLNWDSEILEVLELRLSEKLPNKYNRS